MEVNIPEAELNVTVIFAWIYGLKFYACTYMHMHVCSCMIDSMWTIEIMHMHKNYIMMHLKCAHMQSV